ncbi:MAG: hypothetical protein IJ829_05820, partial [Kiritimatiellae bacterium]|nr:hypothetical protein [Kiritimatiellia bacterium]
AAEGARASKAAARSAAWYDAYAPERGSAEWYFLEGARTLAKEGGDTERLREIFERYLARRVGEGR